MKPFWNSASSDADDARTAGGELHVKQNKTMDLVAKIGCVLVAFIIWLYAAGTDSPTFEADFVAVPIEIVNESGLSVLSTSGSYTTITVRGLRNVIRQLNTEDIHATVRLNSADHGTAGRYTVPVEFFFPSGVSLAASSVTSVSVHLDQTGSVTVPVVVNVTDYILEDGYELAFSEIKTALSEITVTGPQAELDKISCARVTVEPGHLSGTVTCNSPLTLIDAAGLAIQNNSLRMSASHTDVTVPVYQYRTIPLGVTYKYGYFNAENVLVTVEPATLLIKGEASDIAAASWFFEIDEKAVLTDTTYHVGINLPDGVINVNGVTSAAIHITTVDTTEMTFSLSEFSVQNPGNLRYEIAAEALNVSLRGPSVLMRYLTPEAITAALDLSGIPDREGTVLVPVAILPEGGYKKYVYELGTYSVPVRILNADDAAD